MSFGTAHRFCYLTAQYTADRTANTEFYSSWKFMQEPTQICQALKRRIIFYGQYWESECIDILICLLAHPPFSSEKKATEKTLLVHYSRNTSVLLLVPYPLRQIHICHELRIIYHICPQWYQLSLFLEQHRKSGNIRILFLL